ncbi:CBS domain-containing protein [Synechococcus sp. PCC 7336]|uniref:CBS domain-containing protein n=1 Tax=Synechococcus sp. PCC 7336 TaxID=195250 RepID=UPI000346F914|nr:CBS domain-containing protein [Synechococcus sp. PCC 7336]
MTQTVADVMTANPICVRPETPLREAVQILAEKRIRGVPVCDRDGQLVGMLSESDLMQRESGVSPRPFVMFLDLAIYLKNPKDYEKELHKVFGETVGEVMSDRPQSVPPDCPLPEAAQQLAAKNVNSLLVVDRDRHLLGIVTRGDVVRAMASE